MVFLYIKDYIHAPSLTCLTLIITHVRISLPNVVRLNMNFLYPY